MPAFSSRSRSPTHPILAQVRRHPFILFGLPFLSLVVASSFALQAFTQTRYDYDGQKVQTLSQAEALGMDKNRKRVDIREEYYVSGISSCWVGTSCGWAGGSGVIWCVPLTPHLRVSTTLSLCCFVAL
jgi:cytochrome c oxidase assembly protein subunit 16